MSTIMKINDVSKTFYTEIGVLDVLKNINLEINEGEIVAIIGPSGSGKSTLLNVISGLIKPTSGSVESVGEIGYMFQKDHLFEWRTVWKNILLGLEITKKNDFEHQENVKKLLEKYGLSEFNNSFPNELSGGMRQRIALIRTLATNPTILLLDEAFSALDYQTRLLVSNDIYKMIKDQNLTSILVTHDISEAISIADRIIVLSNRPASIKKIYKLEFENLTERNPLNVRAQPEFSKYFNLLWNDLND